MKAGYLDTPLPFRDLAKVFPIISENRLPLLTENNFQIHPFYLDPLAYWYWGYQSDPPPFFPHHPYYLELESRRQEEFTIPLSKTSGKKLLRPGYIYNSVKHQRRNSSAKTANGLNTLTASSKRGPSQTSVRIPVADPTRGAAIFFFGGGGGDCDDMELVAAGWCTRKWLRFHQTI